MNREVAFYVSGKADPQPRPRMTRTGRAYNPPTADAWKAAVRAEWANHQSDLSTAGLKLTLCFVLARPAGHWTTKGALAKSAPLQHTSKPDADNLAKAVMDALENAGAFGNDSQITDLRISKRWAAFSEVAGCQVILAEID
jgi:Holliday junction resolvase RusA-like endonuclease